MKLILKLIGGLLLFALLAGLALGLWITWRFQASKPVYEGEMALEGLNAPVEVYRDGYGVPHIFAQSERDAFFALGAVHAQERLFQMDLIRRSVEGRLSELAGGLTSGVDVRNRALGRHITARQIADRLQGPARDASQAYTDGVNAFVASRAYKAPPEYALLFASFEPWELADTATVILYMADQLADSGDDFTRLTLEGRLSPDKLEEFLGPYPDDAPITASAEALGLLTPEAPETEAEAQTADPLADPGPRPRGRDSDAPGSNAWVAGGARTVSGLPLLANDPHLAPGFPSIWYLARISFPGADWVGATLPGSPFLTLGRNRQVAWGFTNGQTDVTDFIPASRRTAPTESRIETVKVRFGAPITVEHAKIGDAVVLDPGLFGWTNLADPPEKLLRRSVVNDPDNDTSLANYRMLFADSVEAFFEASEIWTVPQQNMMVADTAGNFGYTVPGRVPVRGPGGVWTGEVPRDALPRLLNPAQGYVLNTNNRLVPDAYPYSLSEPWGAQNRARRGVELIEARAANDVDRFRAMQLDTVSVMPRFTRAVLQAAQPQSALGQAARALLMGWEGDMAASAPEPAIYRAWLDRYWSGIVADELGEAARVFTRPRSEFLERLDRGDLAQWCDDQVTQPVETCAQIAATALDAVTVELAQEFGEDPTTWRWDAVNRLRFAHPVFGDLPILETWFAREIGVGGDFFTLNRANSRGQAAYRRVVGIASFRGLYDLSALDDSLYIHAPGQSGHPLSPHAFDLIDLWRTGEYLEIRADWSPDAPPPGYKQLRFQPARP
ncbi:MAG: penicillin acylase family protein [Maricaulaceae bacterium]